MKALAFGALALLAGCREAPEPDTTHNAAGDVAVLPDAVWANVSRVTDKELGVVCYVSDGYKSGGISCIRIPE